MRIEKNEEYYSTAIRNCEHNISYIENSNFCAREKAVLKRSYQKQIKYYKQQLEALSQPLETVNT